jgi:type II secretory pathway pseudopilin PulG
MGLFLTVAARVWSTTEQREREKQLLFVGHAYRSAIGAYVAHMGHYPLSLSDLLGTSDSAVPQRFLRQLYPDPLSGSGDWTLIMLPGGDGIMGVASSSPATPIKHANFDPVDSAFADAATYRDWQFVYVQRIYRRAATPKPP